MSQGYEVMWNWPDEVGLALGLGYGAVGYGAVRYGATAYGAVLNWPEEVG